MPDSVLTYQCANCGEISTSTLINEVTLNECCANRAERRKYVPIEKTSKYDHRWYRCPECKQNIRLKGWTKI